jgi:predicted nucleic acid-binding protein
MALICDTGPLYAAMDRRDEAHIRCARLLADWGTDILVPAPVLVEVEFLSSSRLGDGAFDALLTSILSGGLRVVELITDDYRRIQSLARTYSDLPLGFVDASVVAVAERLKASDVATLDLRHFSVVRPLHVRAFRLQPA